MSFTRAIIMLTGLAALASPVWAQPTAARISAGGEVAFGRDDQPRSDLTVVAPTVTLAYRRSAQDGAIVTWGAASLGDTGVENASLIRAGNPWLQWFLARTADGVAWQVGAGATVPLAHVALGGTGRTDRSVLDHAMGVRGLWNFWQWAPDRFAVPLVGRFTLAIDERTRGHAEAGLAGLFAVRDPERGFVWTAQAALALCHDLTGWLSACGRMHVVALPSSAADKAQSAMGIGAVWLPQSWRLSTSLLLNIDEPLGRGRGAGMWGVLIGRPLAGEVW